MTDARFTGKRKTRIDRRLLLTALAGALAPAQMALAQSNSIAARVQGVLSVTDYLRAKLAFDAIINPSLDHASTSRAVERLAGAANERAGANADDARKLASIRTVIYEPGVWNDNRPFAYDMRDPLGRNLNNKLMATYVSTRLGNCVSMPILFLILADRLGLNVGLATAPHHVFVRFTAADGHAVNLETTSGGHPARDVWYRQNMPMTDTALANGMYMRTLSRRESVATIAMVVAEYLHGAGRYEEAIDVAEAIQEYTPRDIQPMLIAASSYGRLFTREFEERYPNLGAVPTSLHARYRMLAEMNAGLFARAEALGWRPSEE